MPPLPAVIVSCSPPALVPFTVLLKLTFAPTGLPPPLVVSMAVVVPVPFRATGLSKLTVSALVVIVRGPVTETAPVPALLIWRNGPSVLMSLLMVSVPGTSSCTAPPAVVWMPTVVTL